MLGPRLIEIVEAATDAAPGRTAEDIFGGIDAMKLQSSLALFREAGGGAPFEAAIARFGNPIGHSSV